MKRVIVLAGLAFCTLYFVDYSRVRFKLPRGHEPFGVVRIQTSYAVKQKDGKVEYYFNPPENQACVHALFPHFGYLPCWYLQRQSAQQINM